MLNFHSHLTFTASYEYMTYFQVLYTQLKQKKNCLKASGYEFSGLLQLIFKGWSKMTLKVKMACISIFRKGFRKIL